MRRISVIAAAAALLLCGCSDAAEPADEPAGATAADTPLALPPAPSSAAPSSSAPSSSPSAPAEPNERGNVVQVTGEQAGIEGPDGRSQVIFSIDSVVVDQPCSGERSAATNGHYLGVQVRVTTGDLAFLGGTWSMSANDFAIVQPDGTMRFDLATEGALRCLGESSGLPATALEPGRKYTGTIVLDSPVTSGTLVFAPPGLQGNGWEWQF